jgi:hypothetical protein
MTPGSGVRDCPSTSYRSPLCGETSTSLRDFALPNLQSAEELRQAQGRARLLRPADAAEAAGLSRAPGALAGEASVAIDYLDFADAVGSDWWPAPRPLPDQGSPYACVPGKRITARQKLTRRSAALLDTKRNRSAHVGSVLGALAMRVS